MTREHDPVIPLAGVLCRGETIVLGWPEEHEFDAITALRNQPHVRERFLDPRPLDPAANRVWLRSGMKRPEEALLAIRRTADGALCGTIGWTRWDRAAGSFEIGRLVVDQGRYRHDRQRSATGRAIGAEASVALCDFGFARMGLNTIRSVYIGDNALSARLHRAARGTVVHTGRMTRRDGSVVTVTEMVLQRDTWIAHRGDAWHD